MPNCCTAIRCLRAGGRGGLHPLDRAGHRLAAAGGAAVAARCGVARLAAWLSGGARMKCRHCGAPLRLPSWTWAARRRQLLAAARAGDLVPRCASRSAGDDRGPRRRGSSSPTSLASAASSLDGHACAAGVRDGGRAWFGWRQRRLPAAPARRRHPPWAPATPPPLLGLAIDDASSAARWRPNWRHPAGAPT